MAGNGSRADSKIEFCEQRRSGKGGLNDIKGMDIFAPEGNGRIYRNGAPLTAPIEFVPLRVLFSALDKQTITDWNDMFY